MKKKAYINDQYCVACGCCLTACKAGAIAIMKGIKASIDSNKCVGCGMCAKNCPASIMLTSTILELITMVLFKPRSWCVYCPMATMTQMICKIKA